MSYWPNTNNAISEMVRKWSHYLTFRNKYQKVYIILHDIPKVSMMEVATDLLSTRGPNMLSSLITIQRFVEVERLQNASSQCVITNVKKIFARHGIPKEFFSDNGSQYTSGKFRNFVSEWVFKHFIEIKIHILFNSKQHSRTQW